MNAIDRLITRWWINQRASLAVLLKRNATAIRCYRELLAINPDDRIARANLGNLLMEGGDASAAANAFTELVERDPDNAEAWFNLGYIHEQRDRLADAERCLRRAIELKATIDRAWYGLGLVLIRGGRLREALDVLKKNIELQPFSPYGYYQLAMTHHHLGESAQAWRIHDKLKGFEPRYAATLRRDLDQTPPHLARPPDSSTRSTSDNREALVTTE